jgi:hypothetical protein
MVLATLVLATVIFATLIISAVIVAAMSIAIVVVAVQDLRRHPLGERAARIAIRVRRSRGEQRCDENEGHWAFHLDLLSGSVSIRCGASIELVT